MPWRLCGLRQSFRRLLFRSQNKPLSIFQPPFATQCTALSLAQMQYSVSAAQLAASALQVTPSHIHDHNIHSKPPRNHPTSQQFKSPNAARAVPSRILAVLDGAYGQGVTQETANAVLESVRHSRRLHSLLINGERVCAIAERLVETSHPHKAHQLLRLAHKLGAHLKQSVFERVVYRLAEGKHWHLVLPIVALGKRKTGRSTVRLLNWRARALVEVQNFALLGLVPDGFAAEGLIPNRRTFHIIIRGHLCNHDIGKARDCMKLMVDAGVPIDASTYAVIISAYRGLGPDEHVMACAQQALDLVSSETRTTILNSLMRLFLDKNDFIGASRVLKIFDQRHLSSAGEVPPGEASTAPDGKPGRRYNNAHLLSSKAISPDTATYTMLIDFLARKRDSLWVTSIFQRMKSAGLVPDGRVAAALIRAYFNHGSVETALTVVEEMCRPLHLDHSLFRDLGLRSAPINLTFGPFTGSPTVEVFNALLRGLLDFQGLKATWHVLRIMKAANVEPNAEILEGFMCHLESRENASPKEIIRVFGTLTSNKIRPTLRHVHIILRAALRKERSYVRGVGWNNLAQRLTQRGPAHRLPASQSIGESSSFDPTAGIALPHDLLRSSPIRPILQSLASRGIKSDRATIALRIKREAVTRADISTGRAVFQAMIERGMHPTAHHYAALMEGYAEVGDMKMAADTMTRAASNNVTPNVVMHTILIVGHARMGRPDLAMGAFQNMLRAGVEPDFAAVDAVVSAFFAVKAFKLARRTMIDLWPFVAVFPEELRDAPLKTLALALRARRSPNPRSFYATASREQKQALRWKLERIVRMWKDATTCERTRSSRRRMAHALKDTRPVGKREPCSTSVGSNSPDNVMQK